LPEGNDWLNADAKVYWSEARINAQNVDGEFRKQTTKGGKVENRTRLFSDTFAAHLLTYGGEYYRQEQHPGGATTGFPDAKIDFSSGWLQDEITLRDLPLPCWAVRVMTTTAAAATATTMWMPTNGHPAPG
jgi:hemoglobin/transferrin/lactoferrin receptor protein